ncbi:MAG TPA: hypothetical protein VGV93_02840, partial [Acidimicrobiales bacterium]|nr:hypothetical protein [Acidimicrobiales bacterium]
NDRPYLEQFPYLATPHAGYDLNNPARVTTAGPPASPPATTPTSEVAGPTPTPAPAPPSARQLPVTGWGPTGTSLLAAGTVIASVFLGRRLMRSR